MPAELAWGLTEQRRRLEALVGSFREDFGESDDPFAIDLWLFHRICDVWSLHTQNEAFLPLFRHLFFLLSGESAERLKQQLEDQVAVVHISCRPRVERARISIDSFQPLGGEPTHLIVVGDPQAAGGGFRFTYENSLLALSCRDDYEGHCSKCLHAYALLALVAAPRLIYKVDDDVLLDSEPLFRSHLEDLLRNGMAYAGHPVSGFPNHRKFWHGWHHGKCHSSTLEAIG